MLPKESDHKTTDQPQNPLLGFIHEKGPAGSARELVFYAISHVGPWDLPADPEELKRVLIEAVDQAASLSGQPKQIP
ncbi:MAG: hypothetical protein WC841_05450 [Candidatus Shapirobacteria bacterium]|jgi:hypothetical protein